MSFSVVFRTDASLNIGTGHVMRCLTLADALRERGALCRFVCRIHPGNLIHLIRQLGFEVFSLPFDENWTGTDVTNPVHAAWLGADWATDAEQTKVGAGATVVDWVIVDHYAIDERWERRVRSHCHRLAVIDDLANRDHDCDLLLDQNAVAGAEERYAGRVPGSCRLMLGPRYALLQPQYAELHARERPRGAEIRRVLVYFGGADAKNLTGLAVDALMALDRSDIAVDVVVEPTHPHALSLAERMAGRSNFMIHGRVPTLAPLMMAADLAIGAGGATSWERCCLALPTLVITIAENQIAGATELHRRGLISWLGHMSDVSFEVLRDELKRLLDEGVTERSSKACQELVDGLGASRMVEALSRKI